uniref:Uncharacterized protein n=1 Tax=Aquila chrysaetos chrysaetos TaxID=223781 RepID=A0A663DMF3_AQUCH
MYSMETTAYAGKEKPWSLCLPRVPLEAITPSPIPHLTAVRCIKHISQNAGSTHTSFARTPADLRALWQHLHVFYTCSAKAHPPNYRHSCVLTTSALNLKQQNKTST